MDESRRRNRQKGWRHGRIDLTDRRKDGDTSDRNRKTVSARSPRAATLVWLVSQARIQNKEQDLMFS